MEILFENGVFDTVFRQDNASTHKAHIVLEYLHQQEFVIMKFPPCSPDMNPVELLWTVLKKELFHRFPNTSDLPGHPEAVQHVLAE
jgi:transposase